MKVMMNMSVNFFYHLRFKIFARTPRILLGSLILLSVTACSHIPENNPDQHKNQVYYEPEVVTLEGTITLEIFPGRPEYEDIKKGDEPESLWILNLDQPIEVIVKDGKKDELNDPESGVTKIQLVMDYEKIVPKKLGFKSGKKAKIVGTLFHAQIIHHRTDVLLQVKSANILN